MSIGSAHTKGEFREMPRNTKSASQTRRPKRRDDGTPITVGGGGRPGRGRPVKIDFDASQWDTTNAAAGSISLINDKRKLAAIEMDPKTRKIELKFKEE